MHGSLARADTTYLERILRKHANSSKCLELAHGIRAATRPVTSMISGHLSCKRMRKVGPCRIFHQGQNQRKPNLTLLWSTDSLIFPSCRFWMLDAHNTPKWLKLQQTEETATLRGSKWNYSVRSEVTGGDFEYFGKEINWYYPFSPPDGDHRTQSPLTWSSNSFSSSAEWTWVLIWMSFWQFVQRFNEKRYNPSP